MHKKFSTLLTVATVMAALATSGAPVPAYRFDREISIGGEGGWDYLCVDEVSRRLYVSHATKVVVIDLDKNAIAGEIADTPGVHGIAVAHDLGRGFTSNGKENTVSIVDLASLKTIAKVPTGENPDAIVYESSRKEVYAFNGHGKSATVIDAKSGKVVTTISLSGKPEFATSDPKAGHIFCNIEDKNEVAVIDLKTHKVVGTWPIAPGTGASGMALDLGHHRIFLGCDNKLMVMMDNVSGKVMATVPIGDRVDANCFDPVTQLAFSSNGEGTVTIAHEEAPDKLKVVQTLKTEVGARTMTFDPKTHNIYLASAKFEKPSSEPAGGTRQRPRMIPGTFKVLVYSPAK